jgi:hypothetical protein
VSKLIFVFLILLFVGCSDRHKYRVVGEFSLYSFTPHGIGTRQYFLRANGRKYGPLLGHGKSGITVLNSNLVVFFTITDHGYVFNLLALTNNQLTEIEAPHHGPLVGEFFGSPFPQNQDVVQGISNSVISVLSVRGNERTITEFDIVERSSRETGTQ